MQVPIARYQGILAVKAEPLSDLREGAPRFVVISGPE